MTNMGYNSLSLETQLRNRVFAHFLFFRFQEHVREIVRDKNGTTIGCFTLHGLSHIQAVDESVERLLSLQQPPQQEGLRIGPFERLVLRFCAWSHDLGMLRSIGDDYRKSKNPRDSTQKPSDEDLRKEHDNASAWYLQRQLPSLISGFVESMEKSAFQPKQAEAQSFVADVFRRYGVVADQADAMAQLFLKWIKEEPAEHLHALAFNIASTVNLISGYHRRSEPIEGCPEHRVLMDDDVRSQLLAAVFRLGDALHVDRTRFSPSAFDAIRELPEFTEENRVHWIKSFIISSIRIDPKSFTVHIQADLPRHPVNNDGKHREELPEEELITFVKTDLEEDVSSVSQILLKHGFPAMVGVSYAIHRIPQMPYWDQIKAVLNTIIAAASPNTSQLLKIALDGLGFRLNEAERQAKEQLEIYLLSEIATHISAIGHQLERRRCHQSLRKLANLLRIIKHGYDSHELATPKGILSRELKLPGRLLFTLFEGAHQVFKFQQQQIERVVKHPPDDFTSILEEYDRVVLYGYSQQVLNLIALQKEVPPNFHVLECRTKTKYAPTGHLLYLDGDRYAKRVAAVLSGRTEPHHIWVEPDVAIAKIIKSAGRGQKCMLLVGSNAVYRDGTCVHSLGHLTVASVARQFSCDVIVVTDGSKIGPKPEATMGSEEPERYKHLWLTHNQRVRDELQLHGVTLRNWQEDEIPPALVDRLVVFDKATILRGEDFPSRVSEFEFDAVERFCRDLNHRLLAAILASKRDDDRSIREWIISLKPDAELDTQNWSAASEILAGNANPAASKVWTGELKAAADAFRMQLIASRGPSAENIQVGTIASRRAEPETSVVVVSN